jgi:hypothetical protein
MGRSLHLETGSGRLPGALVISLDFELHWGFFDHRKLNDGLKNQLLEARRAVEVLLRLFEARAIHASWAAVGFLMLENSEQLRRLQPSDEKRPRYTNVRLDPYRVTIGDNERDDPYHYASSLVDKIVSTPGQELASHTFSHYYCLEEGQDCASFSADLQAVCAAAQLHGQSLRSIIFPRNQHNPRYSPVLADHGIQAFRGNPDHPLYRVTENGSDRSVLHRAGRYLDSYCNLSGSNVQCWDELFRQGSPLNVQASRFLRPWNPKLASLEPLKVQRIRRSIRIASSTGGVFHLWWHPHNFASHLDRNIGNLEAILDEYSDCRDRDGMLSLNIREIADMVSSRR